MLYLYFQKTPITAISSLTNLSRVSINKPLEKALNFGVQEALKDADHSPKEPVFTEQAVNVNIIVKRYISNLG